MERECISPVWWKCCDRDPTKTAVGATNAEAPTIGSASRFLISIFLLPSALGLARGRRRRWPLW
jgi:hypothetical protein